MDKGDPTMISLVDLTKTDVVVMAVRQKKLSQCRRVQLLAIISCGVMVVLVFLMSTPRAFPSFSYEKGKGNLVVDRLKGRWFH